MATATISPVTPAPIGNSSPYVPTLVPGMTAKQQAYVSHFLSPSLISPLGAPSSSLHSQWRGASPSCHQLSPKWKLSITNSSSLSLSPLESSLPWALRSSVSLKQFSSQISKQKKFLMRRGEERETMKLGNRVAAI